MLLLQLFLAGAALNLIWEFAHCWLYTTCRRQTWRQNVPLLATMSLKDGFWILVFYVLAGRFAGTADVLSSRAGLGAFLFLALGFSFIDEKISLRLKRWEYAAEMPTVLGVGITPLLEIAITGYLALLIVY